MANQVYNVYAKLKFDDGDIEERRLWLEGFKSEAEAQMAANQAVRYNDMVLAAWVEPAKQEEE